MSSRSLVLVVLIALVLAGGGAWLMFGSSGAASEDGGALVLMPSDAGETHARDRDDDAELATPKAVTQERDEPEPLAERSEAPTTERISHAGSIWVEGRVVFPADTPPDEIVTVVARGKKFKGKEDDAKEYRSEVEPSGKFRVAFAKGTKRGQLAIQARYLYLEKSLRLRTESLPDEIVLEPKLGGCIDVTLLPPSQAPFSEEELDSIKLSAYHHENNRAIFPRQARHVEGPLFRLGGLEGAPDYLVNLESDRFFNKNDSGVGVKPGELTEIEFQIEPGVRLAGRIVDAKGDPVAAAQVQFQGDNLWENVTSDEDGKFDQGGLRDGKVTISVSKKGFEDGSKEMLDLVKGDEFTDLEITLGSGTSISGVVTWPDGTVAPGAKVVLKQERESQNTFWRPDETSHTAEDDGTFEITGLNRNPCTISVRAQPEPEAIEGESASKLKRRKRKMPYWHARMEDVSVGSGKLTFVLQPGGGVRGTVVDDRGTPLEKFKVTATPRGDTPWNNSSTGRVSTAVRDSADGSFVLEGLKEGGFEVHATASDHASQTRESIDVPWNGEPLELVLPRAGSVAGVVYDVEGKPLAGAKVELDYTNQTTNFYRSTDKSTSTDEDGSFLFRSIAPGEMRLEASAPGLADSKRVTLELAAAEERTGVSLTMRVGASLTGVIHPSVGEVADRQVTANGQNGGGWHNTQSDSSGRFEFEGLNPGQYNVSFEPDMSDMDQEDDSYWYVKNSREQNETVELPEGGHVHVTLGAPPAKPIVVTGRVTSGGEPVPDKMINIRKAGSNGRHGTGVRTDSNGTYTGTVDGPGTYTFNIGRGWGQELSFEREIPDQEAITFNFELPTGALAGAVMGPGGDAVKGINVTLDLDEADGEDDEEGRMGTRRAQTDADGRYSFDNLRPGKYTVRVAGRDYWDYSSATKEYGRQMRGDVRVEEGKETKGVDFHLRPAGVVKGTLLDASGSPASGVWIRVKDEDGVSFDMWSSRSDASGRFEVRGLPAGKVILTAGQGDTKSDEVSAEVFEEGTTEVEIVLN